MNVTEYLCTQNNTWKLDKCTTIFITILFELLSFNLFSYSNLINLFKDIDLYIIAAYIRPVFLESQKIYLTIWQIST